MFKVCLWSAITIVGFAVTSVHGAAVPQKKKQAAPAATPKKSNVRRTPQRKPEVADAFSYATLQNVAADTARLYSACQKARFPALAYALEDLAPRIVPEKSEFETDAEYSARTLGAEDAVNMVGPLVVCLRLNTKYGPDFEYDAESQAFSLSLRPHQTVSDVFKYLGKYTSSTRMGVKVSVEASLSFNYNVDLSFTMAGLRTGCLNYQSPFYKARVAVSRSDAPVAKATGYLVFLGRLVHPLIERRSTEGEPTIDSPYDDRSEDWDVQFQPDEAAVVLPGDRQLWHCSLKAEADQASKERGPALTPADIYAGGAAGTTFSSGLLQ